MVVGSEVGGSRGGGSIYRLSSKKCTLIAIFLLVTLSLSGLVLTQSSDDSNAWGGNGSEEDPFLISSQADLALLGTTYIGAAGDGKYFKLTQDIQLTGNWTPIGGGATGTYVNGAPVAAQSFQGTLDGDGFAIKDLRVNTPLRAAGLFGALYGATIKNLVIEVASAGIASTYNAGVNNTTNYKYIGTLAGYVNSNAANPTLIENCSVSGGPTNATFRNYYVGGLIGYARGESTTSTVSGYSTEIKFCYTESLSSVVSDTGQSGSVTYGGGLIGYGLGIGINCSYSAGSVDVGAGSTAYVGGFIGVAVNSKITESSETGNVTVHGLTGSDNTWLGGFAAILADTIVEFCYTTGNVIMIDDGPNGYLGGFAAEITGSTSISSVYSVGNISITTGGWIAGTGRYLAAGTLVGNGGDTGTNIIDSFYSSDGTITSTANPPVGFRKDNGTGVTNNVLKNPDIVPMYDWIATGKWDIDPLENNGFPILTGMWHKVIVIIDGEGYGDVQWAQIVEPTSSSPFVPSDGDYIKVKPGVRLNLKATSKNGGVFYGWKDASSDDIYRDSTYVSSGGYGKDAVTVTAYFKAASELSTLTIHVLPSDGGSVRYTILEDKDPDRPQTGTHTYDTPLSFVNNSVLRLEIVPESSYGFSAWSGSYGNSTTIYVTLNGDITIDAFLYELSNHRTLIINATPATAATFQYRVNPLSTGDFGEWIDYSGNVEIQYNYRVQVKATDNESDSYLFNKWTNASTQTTLATTNQVFMTQDRTFTAEFVEAFTVYAVASPTGSGTFEFSIGSSGTFTAADSVTVMPGTSVSVKAIPADTYKFGFWEGDGFDEVINITSNQTSIPGDSEEVTAYFAKIDDSLSVSVTVIGGGNVGLSVNDLGPITITGSKTVDITRGDKVVLTANEVSGKFSYFIGTVNQNDDVLTINSISKEYNETVYFSSGSDTYTMTVNVNGGGTADIRLALWPAAVSWGDIGTMPTYVDNGSNVFITPIETDGVYRNITVDKILSSREVIYGEADETVFDN
jgi:hypothetical protein